ATSPGPGARPRGPRPARRPGGGAGGGEVPPGLRVHALPSHRGLAPAGSVLRVLWQGDQLPAGHRPPQGLLQDPRSGDPRGDPGEGDRQAPGARPSAGARPAAASLAPGGPGGGRGVGTARSSPAPATDAGRGEATAATGEPGAAAPAVRRGPALDRRRDPGPPRQPRPGPADGPRAAARQLPPRV